jgi:hypothetical protein
MFFAIEKNLAILGSFLSKSSNVNEENSSQSKRFIISIQIINYIHTNPKDWDDRCSFNIKTIGEKFLDSLRNYDSSNPPNTLRLNDIFVSSYRFLSEYDFLLGPKQELNGDIKMLLNQIRIDVFKIDDNENDTDLRSQLIYATYFMPANILKEFINNEDFMAFKKFDIKKSEAENFNMQWKKEFDAKKAEIDALKTKLDDYRTAFNFVGLNQGFLNLAEKKTSELKKILFLLTFIGLLILAPLIVQYFHVYQLDITSDMKIELDHFFLFIPIFSIEIILIYFFRIVLHNYRSVKAQIMQIELRQTLCQFIQNYAEYSNEIKKNNPSALEKFENLIFSGVLSNSENLPSTYDGLEQIAAFIKNIKSP